MSISYVSPEMVDSLSEFLQPDELKALKERCSVSQSAIHPTWPHLNHVNFKNSKSFEKWMGLFPNPAASPACDTHFLRFCSEQASVTNKGVEWIRAFTKVTELEVEIDEVRNGIDPKVSFAPFHNLSSSVKSLKLSWGTLPSREVFDFICSFPHLEHLYVTGQGNLFGVGPFAPPPSLSKLSGTLVLDLFEPDFVHRVLQGSDRLSFRKIVWKGFPGFFGNEVEGVESLVKRCSPNLKYIDIQRSPGASAKPSSYAPPATSSASD